MTALKARKTLHLVNPQIFPCICALVMIFLTTYENRLLRAEGTPSPFSTSKQQATWYQKNKQFARLWRTHHQRKVAREILPFALNRSDNIADLRTRAVIALGRLEDPVASRPLQRLLSTLGAKSQSSGHSLAWPDRIPLWRIRLAIARISFRNLKGQKKLDALARSIGLSWPQVRTYGLQMQEAIETRRNLALARSSYEKDVLNEYWDVLRAMKSKGEDIQRLGAYDLIISPAMSPVLDTASVSQAEQIDFWLQRAMPPTRYGLNPSILLDLGPQVVPKLEQQLKRLLSESQARPEIMTGRSRIGYSALFHTAAATADPRFIPILRQFTKRNDYWTKREAIGALRALQSGAATTILPTPLTE